MTTTNVSRRNFLATGTGALLVAAALPDPASAHTHGDQNLANEEIVRKWYAAWENNDLATFNALLADDFTFTSAAGDDHISKSRFKTQCWDIQVNFIQHFDLERVSHRHGRCLREVSLPHQERQIVPERRVSPNQQRKIGIHRVLLRRTIQLSVGGKHWPKVALIPNLAPYRP